MRVVAHRGNKTLNRLRKNKFVIFSYFLIAFLVILAILAPIIANEKPLYVNYNGTKFFPAFSGKNIGYVSDHAGTKEQVNFTDKTLKYHEGVTVIIMPLIPYSPNKSDMLNTGFVAPNDTQFGYSVNGERIVLKGKNKHLLGTGKRGEDLLAGLIHGTRVSLTVGVFSMMIAGLIGITFGALAGFFGDHQLKSSRGKLFALFIGLVPAWFYGFSLRSDQMAVALETSPLGFIVQLIISMTIFVSILFLFYRAGAFLHFIPWFKKFSYFPIDSIVSRLIEILISLPQLILIITIAAIARPSLTNLILIIGLTSWTEIARFTRAEMMRIKNMEFIESAKSLGLKPWRIMIFHGLPNAVSPALIALSFGVASAILIESGLTFLGIGVPQDIVTWGSLLASGRENFSAWWLVIFPGLAIFLTVTSFNLIGEGLRDAWDPKLKE